MSNDRLALGRQIYDYFVGKGLAPHQAAAIAGNMAWEGGGRIDLVNPGDNIKNSPRSPHSVGVGQWNDRLPALVDYARKSGINLPDGDLRDAGYVRDVARQLPLNTQLDFAWNEMQGPERRAYEGITSGQDLRSAAAGAIGYHRPAGWTRSNPYAGHGFDNRVAIADQILRASQAGGASVSAPSGMSGSAFHAAAFPAPYALGGPKQAAEPVSTSGAAIPAQAKTPATEQPRAHAWDAAGFWDKQMLEGHADGGAVDDDILADYRAATHADPLTDYRTKFRDGPPAVGYQPRSFGTLSATPDRPSDWAVSSGLAETLSPIAQGYGAGQMAGDAYQAAKAGDYGSAIGGGVLSAMGMMPAVGKGKTVAPRAVDPLGYYSAALESAKGLKQAKGTPEQMLKMLSDTPGVKKGELEATGIMQWLKEKYGSTTSTAPGEASAITMPSENVGPNGERISGQADTAGRLKQPSVSRDEIVKYLEDNRLGMKESMYGDMSPAMTADYDEFNRLSAHVASNGGEKANPVETARARELYQQNNYFQYPVAKWSAHSLDPSNPAYRETVLHLPEDNSRGLALLADRNKLLDAKYTDPAWPDVAGYAPGRNVREQLAAIDAEKSALPEAFSSGHFPEPNIVGHMMTSMTKHEGKPVYTLDQIQSDWGQKLRDGGVRDEAKVAALKSQMDNLDLAGKNTRIADLAETAGFKSRGFRGALDHEEIHEFLKSDKPGSDEARGLLRDIDAGRAEWRRLEAEYSTANASSPGHPLVNTTDQWTNTTLRRAIQQAIEAKAQGIAIPTGDTVLTYNPGDTAGMHGFYGRGPRQQVNIGADLEALPGEPSRAAMEGIVPKNLRNMLSKLDRDHPGGTYIDALETPSGMKGKGFTYFPLTDAVIAKAKEGLPLFSAAGLGAYLSSGGGDEGGSDYRRDYANGGRVGRALAIASKLVDRKPTDAQKESGNYAKGHAKVHGLDVTIENPKGSERSGMGKDGKRWSVKMPAIYGYVKGTEGFDGDHVDVYIGPDHDSKKVFVVDQINAEDGKFDEHKCLLSYQTKEAALADYRKAFSDGKADQRIGAVTEMTIDRFKSWVKSAGTQVPLGDIRKKYANGGAVIADEDLLSDYR